MQRYAFLTENMSDRIIDVIVAIRALWIGVNRTNVQKRT